jgi:hypothetical protein
MCSVPLFISFSIFQFTKLFYRILAADNADEKEDDCRDKKDVDESSDRVRGYQTQNPENQQNNCDGNEHKKIE